MDINKIWAVYFSPAGSTRQITLTVAEQIGKSLQKEIREVQYTKWEQRKKTYHFGRDELVSDPCKIIYRRTVFIPCKNVRKKL